MPDHIIKAFAKGVKNGTKNGAKKAAKKAPRVLKKADYEGTAGGHSGFGRFKADMAVYDDKRKGLQKPLFKDDDGRLNYHQSNGKTPSQFRDRDVKQAEVFDRDQKGKQQSKKGVTGKNFLEGRPQVADTQAHHIAPVKSMQFLFDGLDEQDSAALINHFEKRGIYIGNDRRNRADLSSARHTSVHESYAQKEILKYTHQSLEGLDVKERIKFANVLIQEIKEARKMFKGSEIEIPISDFTDGFNGATKPGAIDRSPSAKS
jgi:hypothetical protein